MSVKYRDYYKVLGITKDATETEIKKAFRALARKWHPDVNKAKNASDKFKELNEAYEVLKDSEKRKLYDSFGHNWQEGQNFRPPPGFEGMNVNFGGGSGRGGSSSVSDFFEAIFGGGGASSGGGNPFGGSSFSSGGGNPFGASGGNPFGGGGNPFGASGGGNPFGGGHSCRSQQKPKKKKTEADISLSIEDIYKGGKKEVSISTKESSRTFTVTIPNGTTEGTKIRLSGQGVDGGSLILTVHIKKDKKFTVEKKFNLSIEAEITPSQAALGTKISVETLDDTVLLTVPPCTSCGGKLRLKNKGLIKKDGSRGNLLVKLKIVMKADLSEKEIELYRKLADFE